MRRLSLHRLTVGMLAAFVVSCLGHYGPSEDSLKASFSAQVQGVSSVKDFERHGDDLKFSQLSSAGAMVDWRVTLDSVALIPSSQTRGPMQGKVSSSWYADGQLIEPLGSMSRLPDEFLSIGLAQECYALWFSEEERWDW